MPYPRWTGCGLKCVASDRPSLGHKLPPMARTPSLAKLSVQELQQEIRVRQRRRPALERRRARVAAKLADIDAQIAALGGMVSGGRGQNQEGLTAYLRRALDGKTMGMSEVAEALKRMGYVTNSSNFRTIVNAALMRKDKGFTRVGRGQYTTA